MPSVSGLSVFYNTKFDIVFASYKYENDVKLFWTKSLIRQFVSIVYNKCLPLKIVQMESCKEHSWDKLYLHLHYHQISLCKFTATLKKQCVV